MKLRQKNERLISRDAQEEHGWHEDQERISHDKGLMGCMDQGGLCIEAGVELVSSLLPSRHHQHTPQKPQLHRSLYKSKKIISEVW